MGFVPSGELRQSKDRQYWEVGRGASGVQLVGFVLVPSGAIRRNWTGCSKSYAIEKCRIEARRRGHAVTEQQLEDGSVRLQIVEGG